MLALPGQEGWGILGIGLMDVESERAKAEALQGQKGLYSLVDYPPEGTPERVGRSAPSSNICMRRPIPRRC